MNLSSQDIPYTHTSSYGSVHSKKLNPTGVPMHTATKRTHLYVSARIYWAQCAQMRYQNRHRCCCCIVRSTNTGSENKKTITEKIRFSLSLSLSPSFSLCRSLCLSRSVPFFFVLRVSINDLKQYTKAKNVSFFSLHSIR